MSFRSKCSNISLDAQTFVLSADCKTSNGSTRRSTIELAKCIRWTASKEREGIEPNNGEFPGVLTLGERSVKSVHLAEDSRYFRAFVTYEFEKSLIEKLPFVGTAVPLEQNWKWAQVDLDQHLRVSDGCLEFFTPVHSTFWTWLQKTAEDNAPALGDLGTGIDPGASQFNKDVNKMWGVDRAIEEMKQAQKDKEDKWWWEGTYLDGQGDKTLVRRGT